MNAVFFSGRERQKENSSLDAKQREAERRISKEREKPGAGKKRANEEECRDCIIP